MSNMATEPMLPLFDAVEQRATYTVRQLEKIADIVLSSTGFNDKNVDIVKVANLLGYSVFQADLGGSVAGMVEKNSSEAKIFINENELPERQRFTIAHEIGHILLHHNGGQDIDFTDYRNNDRYDKKEFEADNFAAALLMPKARSLEVWGLTGDVDDFARAMKVSRKAAAIRLINLGLI